MIVERNTDNLKHCKCMKCPSYSLGCKIKSTAGNLLKLMEDMDKLEHYEKMFCAFDKSHCINEDKGCICTDCAVHKKYNLVREDYCIISGGSSKGKN